MSGVRLGENKMGFVGGVGANSATVAYGTNRATFMFLALAADRLYGKTGKP